MRIAIDDAVVAWTLETLKTARAVASAGVIPAPLVDSPKCPRCSLVGICLPDETQALRAAAAADDAQLRLFDTPESSAPTSEPRRLVPARDDLRPLHVIGQGLSVVKSGDVLQVRDVRERKKLVQEARLHEVSQVNLFGHVQLSTQAHLSRQSPRSSGRGIEAI